MSSSSDPFSGRMRTTSVWALVVGAVGSAPAGVGYLIDPDAFFPAYLVAYLFWLGISLGCLAIAMIHHLSGGGWGFALRRILEAGYGLVPLMALLFVPILFGMQKLYPWARPSVVAEDEILRSKQAYLNVEGFQIRAAVYFAVWIVLGFVLNRMTSSRDPAGEYPRRRRLALLSGPGLILWVLTVTFASVDWAMSLEPHWFSSMYGVLFMAGQGVSGLSLALITLVLLRDVRPISDMYSVARQHDLGNLLLAFVLFWSYVSFAQYLIIWSGNLPEETPWYISRGGATDGETTLANNGWRIVALLLIVLHFVVPFLLLLSRQSKQTPRMIVGIAALLLVMRFVDLYWLVMPAFSPQVFKLHWLNVVTPLAIGGLWVAGFAWRLAARAPLPVFDLPGEEETADELARHAAH